MFLLSSPTTPKFQQPMASNYGVSSQPPTTTFWIKWDPLPSKSDFFTPLHRNFQTDFHSTLPPSQSFNGIPLSWCSSINSYNVLLHEDNWASVPQRTQFQLDIIAISWQYRICTTEYAYIGPTRTRKALQQGIQEDYGTVLQHKYTSLEIIRYKFAR